MEMDEELEEIIAQHDKALLALRNDQEQIVAVMDDLKKAVDRLEEFVLYFYDGENDD